MTPMDGTRADQGGDLVPATPQEIQPQPAGARKPKRKMTFRLIASVVLGAAGGLAYYKFIGCRSGACPITSNPYISTAYGAVIGYFVSGGWT
jgi:hypothetical protein